MIVNLKDIHFYILNLAKHPKKKIFMEKQMEKLGYKYTFIEAIEARKPIGVGLSHLKALTQYNLKVPFAILEDDCKFFDLENPKNIFNLPDNTDSLYLGQSVYGLREIDHLNIRWGGEFKVEYEIYNEHYLKVNCMLARHAIVYLSDKFHKNAIEACRKSLFKHFIPIPGDLSYGEMQKDHLVITPNNPICYQSEHHGGFAKQTKYSILDIKK